uniref:Uncharacterized protein n=1 Tax=Oryza glumipatula TaxID=40148 RepID=A0A0E0A9W1_9ORYZ
MERYVPYARDLLIPSRTRAPLASFTPPPISSPPQTHETLISSPSASPPPRCAAPPLRSCSPRPHSHLTSTAVLTFVIRRDAPPLLLAIIYSPPLKLTPDGTETLWFALQGGSGSGGQQQLDAVMSHQISECHALYYY